MNKETKAHQVLDKLFSSVKYFDKETSFVLVKVDNCTLYLPLQTLDESLIPEFRKRFMAVYELSQGR